MPVFFNNCHGRDHSRLFGAEAFYDLNLTGRQATMATDLGGGDECVVATPDPLGDIDFRWFAFSHEQVLPAEEGTKVRVLFGKWLRSEKLTKIDAAATEPYSIFFNVNGHFKRQSVISA